MFPNTAASIARQALEWTTTRADDRSRLERIGLELERLAKEEKDSAVDAPSQVVAVRAEEQLCDLDLYAFNAKMQHDESAGLLRIVLHFVTEFLDSDIAQLYDQGTLGGWSPAALIHAFLHQFEDILSQHPFFTHLTEETFKYACAWCRAVGVSLTWWCVVRAGGK
jgi:hypothetical protein